MSDVPRTAACHTAGEWTLHSEHPYENPFADVTVEAKFTSPTGKTFVVPGFYNGERT